MATSLIQIHIDTTVKAEANELSNELGIDLSSAANMFPRQHILHGGLSLEVELPRFSTKTLTTMEETRRTSRDPNTPSYSSMGDLGKALLFD